MINAKMDSTNAQVQVETLVQVVKGLGRTNYLSSEILRSAYLQVDKKFNNCMGALAALPGDPEGVGHVFEWEGAGRLWKTFLTGTGNNRLVTYTFLPSTQNVPLREEFKDVGMRRWKFKDKAEAFENSEPFTISRKKARFLVYINDNDTNSGYRGGRQFRKRNTFGSQTTFSTGPSEIVTPAGDKYKGKFQNHFVAFWLSSAGSQAVYKDLMTKMRRSWSVRTTTNLVIRQRTQKASTTLAASAIDSQARARANKILEQLRRDVR